MTVSVQRLNAENKREQFRLLRFTFFFLEKKILLSFRLKRMQRSIHFRKSKAEKIVRQSINLCIFYVIFSRIFRTIIRFSIFWTSITSFGRRKCYALLILSHFLYFHINNAAVYIVIWLFLSPKYIRPTIRIKYFTTSIW